MRHIAYLDHHATTPMDPRVLMATNNANRKLFGNAGSRTHPHGLSAQNSVRESRQKVASLLSAEPDTIVFLSGATEANNLAVFGVCRETIPRQQVIASAAEHRSILEPVSILSGENSRSVFANIESNGRVDVDAITGSIVSDTIMVTIILANNEVGTINPIIQIGNLCRERGIIFHTDATQAVGKIPINVSQLPIDLMSFSAHKIYGPKGVGALYVCNEQVLKRIRPLIYGGGHERGLRSGTLPVPLIVGFGKACELCQELMPEESIRIKAMRDHLWERFQTEIPDVVLNGDPTERLYNNLNVSFLGVPSESFMIKLRDVVAVSAGSACTSAKPEPSHVLRAMNVGHERLESAIRFGLGRFNTMEEIDYVADQVKVAVAELRSHLQSPSS